MTTDKTIKVVPIFDSANVSIGLRNLADEIDSGKWGDVKSLSLVVDGGESGRTVFGIGATDIYRAVAMFTFAIAELTR